MCVKLPLGDLNPGHCLSHLTSTYTCRVTIAPRVCGGFLFSLFGVSTHHSTSYFGDWQTYKFYPKKKSQYTCNMCNKFSIPQSIICVDCNVIVNHSSVIVEACIVVPSSPQISTPTQKKKYIKIFKLKKRKKKDVIVIYIILRASAAV